MGEASRSHALFLGSFFSYSPKREFLIFNFENQLILEGFQLPEVRNKIFKKIARLLYLFGFEFVAKIIEG